MAKTSKPSKKEVRQQIAQKLEQTFSELKEMLGKTKFKRNIKKASKALAEDVKLIEAKAPKAKKPSATAKNAKDQPGIKDA